MYPGAAEVDLADLLVVLVEDLLLEKTAPEGLVRAAHGPLVEVDVTYHIGGGRGHL